jgi:hypothetical protein
MSNNDDDFADIRNDVEGMGFGSLSGLGADNHDSVKTKIAKDGSGFDNQIRCEGCGKTLVVTIPWSELIIMGHGVLPPNNSFIYNPKRACFMPSNTCVCGAPIRLGVTPDECARHLKAGVAARKITPQQIRDYEIKAGLVGPGR